MSTWFMTLDALWRLFCEAETLEDATETFRRSGHFIPTQVQRDESGRPAVDPATKRPQMSMSLSQVPPDIDGWLRMNPPPHCVNRTIGGWLTESGAFVPVHGTENSRVVERRLIAVPAGTIPSSQGWPNGG